MRAAWRGLLLVVLVAGCAGDYETFQPPPLDFSGQPELHFAVDRIDVESAYRPAGAPPFVDHTLALTPEAATRAYLEQKLRAVGGPGRLEAVILDASVKEQALETQGGVRGLLTTESSARLDGRVRVRVERFDAAGNSVGSIGTAASLSRYLSEDVGYAERQRIGYELVRDLVNELAAGLAANLRETFADILRP
jgi:hypothetical protein